VKDRVERERLFTSTAKEGIDLKKGAIICIDGKPPDNWTKNNEVAFRNQLTKYDAVRFITPQIDAGLLNGIWFNMLARGITDLVVAIATFSETGQLKLSGKGCRLPMIGMS
jgi:hypothetical protein